MKIKAHISVERIDLGGVYTFRTEVHDVEVIRVLRYPATRNRALNRWHYQADIKDHPALSPDAIRTGAGLSYRVNIQRRGLNDAWKPPAFPAGTHVFEVAAQAQGDQP